MCSFAARVLCVCEKPRDIESETDCQKNDRSTVATCFVFEFFFGTAATIRSSRTSKTRLLQSTKTCRRRRRRRHLRVLLSLRALQTMPTITLWPLSLFLVDERALYKNVFCALSDAHNTQTKRLTQPPKRLTQPPKCWRRTQAVRPTIQQDARRARALRVGSNKQRSSPRQRRQRRLQARTPVTRHVRLSAKQQLLRIRRQRRANVFGT